MLMRSAAQIGSSCSGLEVCREQLQNTDKVILMLHHFPTCPIFTTRGPASNGYAQVKSTSVQPLYGAQPYVHRIAAMFRKWEQYPTWTLEQMAQFVADGVEATQLLLTPLSYVSKRQPKADRLRVTNCTAGAAPSAGKV